MLYSPDTDVYHIGLPLLEQTSEIYIQLHGRRKDSNRYLHVNKLVQALHSDPDLAQVPVVQRTAILQMVYVPQDAITSLTSKALVKSSF